MAVVSLSSVVVPWPGTAAPRPRKHSEGQAHVGAGSAAPDPRSVCVWWLFSECEVVSFVLHFSVIFSAAEIPRGQSQERGHGAEDPAALHTGALGPLLLEVRDTAGHKSHARRGGARCRRERARGLPCRRASTRRGRDLALPTPDAVLRHWTPTPALGATAVQWVTGRESSSMSHALKFV